MCYIIALCSFHCITHYSLVYQRHKDLDVMLAFSLFFTERSLLRKKARKRKALRSLLKLIKYRKVRTDDNHAAAVKD